MLEAKDWWIGVESQRQKRQFGNKSSKDFESRYGVGLHSVDSGKLVDICGEGRNFMIHVLDGTIVVVQSAHHV